MNAKDDLAKDAIYEMQLCLTTNAEKSRRLPGDDIVASPNIESTHAVSINAACRIVWPWIVQIGQGRGGFYSYTILENLLGCEMKNADRVHPQWQSLSVGDPVSIHPRVEPLTVALLEPESHLVLKQRNRNFTWTWAFYVRAAGGADSSRLLVRTRLRSNGALKIVLYPVMTLGHYVMERKMLLGIKRRSENSIEST